MADGTRGKQRALSDVAALIEKEQFSDALRVARTAGLHLTDDPQTRQLLRRISITSTIRTEPEGADVYIKDYLCADQEWEHLGKSPILNTLLPFIQLRWRIAKPGWETAEGAGFFLEEQRFVLRPAGAGTPGMVVVPRGSFRFGSTLMLDEYRDRPVRGDQRRVQAIRRRRRLHAAGALETSVRQGWPDAVLGRGDARVS